MTLAAQKLAYRYEVDGHRVTRHIEMASTLLRLAATASFIVGVLVAQMVTDYEYMFWVGVGGALVFGLASWALAKKAKNRATLHRAHRIFLACQKEKTTYCPLGEQLVRFPKMRGDLEAVDSHLKSEVRFRRKREKEHPKSCSQVKRTLDRLGLEVLPESANTLRVAIAADASGLEEPAFAYGGLKKEVGRANRLLTQGKLQEYSEAMGAILKRAYGAQSDFALSVIGPSRYVNEDADREIVSISRSEFGTLQRELADRFVEYRRLSALGASWERDFALEYKALRDLLAEARKEDLTPVQHLAKVNYFRARLQKLLRELRGAIEEQSEKGLREILDNLKRDGIHQPEVDPKLREQYEELLQELLSTTRAPEKVAPRLEKERSQLQLRLKNIRGQLKKAEANVASCERKLEAVSDSSSDAATALAMRLEALHTHHLATYEKWQRVKGQIEEVNQKLERRKELYKEQLEKRRVIQKKFEAIHSKLVRPAWKDHKQAISAAWKLDSVRAFPVERAKVAELEALSAGLEEAPEPEVEADQPPEADLESLADLEERLKRVERGLEGLQEAEKQDQRQLRRCRKLEKQVEQLEKAMKRADLPTSDLERSGARLEEEAVRCLESSALRELRDRFVEARRHLLISQKRGEKPSQSALLKREARKLELRGEARELRRAIQKLSMPKEEPQVLREEIVEVGALKKRKVALERILKRAEKGEKSDLEAERQTLEWNLEKLRRKDVEESETAERYWEKAMVGAPPEMEEYREMLPFDRARDERLQERGERLLEVAEPTKKTLEATRKLNRFFKRVWHRTSHVVPQGVLQGRLRALDLSHNRINWVRHALFITTAVTTIVTMSIFHSDSWYWTSLACAQPILFFPLKKLIDRLDNRHRQIVDMRAAMRFGSDDNSRRADMVALERNLVRWDKGRIVLGFA